MSQVITLFIRCLSLTVVCTAVVDVAILRCFVACCLLPSSKLRTGRRRHREATPHHKGTRSQHPVAAIHRRSRTHRRRPQATRRSRTPRRTVVGTLPTRLPLGATRLPLGATRRKPTHRRLPLGVTRLPLGVTRRKRTHRHLPLGAMLHTRMRKLLATRRPPLATRRPPLATRHLRAAATPHPRATAHRWRLTQQARVPWW